MQSTIHPKYHEIKVVFTDGSEHTMRSTWGKEGDVMRLDIDPLNHPAWTGGASRIVEKGRLAKFGNKYAGLGVATTDKVPGAEQEKKEAAKA
jgi:large subunit ribosomal protein L31